MTRPETTAGPVAGTTAALDVLLDTHPEAATAFDPAELSRLDEESGFPRAATDLLDRLGVPVVAVEAVDGAIGEDEATAFLCPTPAGEDRMVRCPSCEYAADPAKATSRLDPVPDGPGPLFPVSPSRAARRDRDQSR